MTTPQNSNIQFTKANIDHVYEKLISTDAQLKEYFNKYIQEEYPNSEVERLHYNDIAEISKYLTIKLKNNETDNFPAFFIEVENILSNCDVAIENLVIVGLFEGIQNIGGQEINYYTGFNKWLKPLSKSRWDKLIDFWEGEEWRK